MKKISLLISAIICMVLFCSCVEDIKPMSSQDIIQDAIVTDETASKTTSQTQSETLEITQEEMTDNSIEITEETTILQTTQETQPPETTTEETTTAETTTETTTVETTTKETSKETTSPPPLVIVPNNYTPLNYSVQKGVWFAYLDINPFMKGSSELQFRNYINTAFTNVKNLGANTVYVHARAYGDAYYPSDYFTWTDNKNGCGLNPGYDPLKIMIEIAHSYGLSFHAWVNPMRTMTADNLASMSNSYQIKQWYNDSYANGRYLVKPSGNNYYWLNPAYSEVRQLINNGIAEIVQNYDIDGIHIDDYFYPTTDSSFDRDAFNASGESNLTSFRLSTISKMVSNIYSTVKQINPDVLFGVSPQGNMSNNYSFMYADVKTWCSTPGYLDYIVPQVYFGFTNKWQPFDTCSKGWDNIVTLDSVKLVIGLAPYKADGAHSDYTGTKIIATQIEHSLDLKNNDGVALYRYALMFNTSSTTVKNEVDAIREVLNG